MKKKIVVGIIIIVVIICLLVGFTIYNNSDPQSPDLALEEIGESYTLEDAKADGCVVYENIDITSGQEVWDQFLRNVKMGRKATVRLAFYYTLDEEKCEPEYYESVKDEYPKMYVSDLTYDGELYIIRGYEDGKEYKKSYKYMMRYEDEAETETATYDSYLRYVLTNDNHVTWEQIMKGMASSQMGDGIDHRLVYIDLRYER